MKANEFVTSVSGNEVLRRECIKIGDKFYKKGVDCVSVEGKWFRINHPKIYFDKKHNEYRMVKENTHYGIVGYNRNTGEYEFGHFETNKLIAQYINSRHGRNIVINKEVFDSIPKVYLDSGDHVDYTQAVRMNYFHRKRPKNDYFPYKTIPRLYNSADLIETFLKVQKEVVLPDAFNPYAQDKRIVDILNKYSFGIEYETSSGVIPENECYTAGLIPLRDGSISGIEYTSVPMLGVDGINKIFYQTKLLNEYCTIDKECSLHIHLGNFPLNEVKITKLWNLAYRIQDDLSRMFHKYVFQTSAYKESGKDYCNRLPSIVSDFEDLYSYLSTTSMRYEKGNFFEKHPRNPNFDHKWDNNRRYFWFNLINLLFDNKGKTVEFRLHGPTFNPGKIINWLLIIAAILKFAEGDDTEIKGVTLTRIIKYAYEGSPAENILLDYIDARREEFAHSASVYSDVTGALDIFLDESQKYSTPIIM